MFLCEVQLSTNVVNIADILDKSSNYNIDYSVAEN